MRYKIVKAESCYELEEKVDDMIKHGWKLQGGVSFVYHSSFRETWAQAMKKDDHS